ncbi:hypothetical protein CathTA2_3100 [Caldalkalibacillus thermarum TA2.A1]|uniref:DUF2892 domain-containing protein n=1 Tax=Caldalkalibacillus thermarum (strain TA2.A1) TaxID=986075 RepID=F5LB15_CALTT|nr:DUF2892 domain-containing protein [Caldalkalibacillus thermarum]EGL81554.1 hypothetical protein CathTA2_3100 [Caldalkalibacillus thermarum TA2.A1]QZT33846.1 DUF2892 domain-containing protein [Caldalkalibacillus thermarum TA2.A1]GGK23582.1 hypothetical protein GCM10010965_15480 [Caldalkalibacillus thermarum]
MKKNVGTFDAIMRITFGLTGLAWGTAQMVRHPNRGFPMVVTMASAMKVAEGVTRYCPMLAMLNMTSTRMLTPDRPRQAPRDYEASDAGYYKGN